MTRPLPAAAISGQPVTRVDGRLKVTGKALYASDNPAPDLVYAALVCSTIARGSVERIDQAAAVRDREVLRVITDFGGVKLPYDIRQVSCFGQPVAVVVATTLEAAMHGAALVEVRYRPGPQLTNIDAPQAEQKQGTRTRDYARGDADDALRGAAVVTDLHYSIMRNNHNPMEIPATIASWDGDRLTVWDKVQSISGAQKTYADAFGVPGDHVRVISPFVGGAFGSAGTTWPHQLLAAFAARQIRRPVKLLLTRKQYYSGIGYRPTSRQRHGDRCRPIRPRRLHRARSTHRDLAVQRVRGQPDDRSPVPVRLAEYAVDVSRCAAGYQSADVHARPRRDQRCVRVGVGHGRPRVPARNGSDRTAAAQRTRPRSVRKPAVLHPEAHRLLPSGAATRSAGHVATPHPRSTRDGNQLIGIGMAAAGYHTSRSQCSALARINPDGTADVQCGTSDMGPGTYTSMTQVAADALGLPLNRVRFALGDSRFPEAPSHSGSRTMASVGSAVFATANMLRDRFVRTAVVDPGSPLNGLRPEEVSVGEGRMFHTGDATRGESYQDLLRRRGWESLDAQQTWSPDDADTRFSMSAYGAVFAEVAVDETLGTVRIRRIYACYDAGRIINPKLAHSQAIGGMVGGIGMALLEGTQLDYRDGRIVNANMSDYLVPVNADVPALDATYLPAEDTIADPLGVKGLGELVIVGVPAAIANAVFNATGRRVTDLPITLEKLL